MALHLGLDTLTHDAAPFGTLQAPLLSWIGAAVLLALCLWPTTVFLYRTRAMEQALHRLAATLRTIVQERQTERPLTASVDLWTARSRSTPREVNSRDLQDIQRIQTLVEAEPWLMETWMSYRQTLVAEQTPWYADPRLFTSQPAGESFPLAPLLTGRLNLSWYQQLPSLLTGLGLLLTFIALLIGLSHLHAEGGTIVGVQGLVNGLAGKFLTSIVGLICAHGATLVEKRMVFRLVAVHRACTQALDRLFPRTSMQDWLNGLNTDRSVRRATPFIPPPSPLASRPSSPDPLTTAMAAMTAAVTTLSQDLRAHLTTERPRLDTDSLSQISHQLAPLLERLTTAVETLTHQMPQRPPVPDQSAHATVQLADQLITRMASSKQGRKRSHSWLFPLRALEEAWRAPRREPMGSSPTRAAQ